MTDTLILKLRKPIQAHGDPLKELTLRKPTVDELIAHGSPYVIVGTSGAKPDYRACAGLLSAVCAIPPSSVSQLDAADFNAAAMQLLGFTNGAAAGGATESGSTANS